MTTQLKDGSTYFVPFNQGTNGAGVDGGAGNPLYPDGYATHYLWEEVLQRDSILDLLHRFISHVKEKKKDGEPDISQEMAEKAEPLTLDEEISE